MTRSGPPRAGSLGSALLVLAGVVTAGVLAPGAATAEPTGFAITRQCLDPVLDRPVTASISANLETTVFAQPGPDTRALTGSVTLPGAGLAALGATRVEGTARIRVLLSGSPAVGPWSTVTVDLRPTDVVPGQDVQVPVIGYTSSFADLRTFAAVTVDVDGIDALTLVPRRADGTALPTVTTACPRGDAPAVPWHVVRGINGIAEVLRAPEPMRVTGVTSDSATLEWGHTGGSFWTVVGFEVLADERRAALVPATEHSTTVTGLEPDTEYYVRVRAVDKIGLYARATYPVKIRTQPRATTYHYSLTGTATVQGRPVPLAGTLDTTLGSRTHTSVLDLRPADVVLSHRPPLSARLEFRPEGDLAGTFADGVLTSTARVAVAVTHVVLPGREVPLPASCRTAPAEIPLASGPGFDPAAGGALTGTFTLPPLSGCGPLTDVVNGLVAGSGNTVAVDLVPREPIA
ncbi:fibronectin type III domain-containing protein [Actinosynnema sp. NPDC050436]|uniref:fibronectin type III domain-containing protein n=1 Tax=Actinosynnema sp. NPDC050436 TaxID=3155659 RepID=UPI0033E311F1